MFRIRALLVALLALSFVPVAVLTAQRIAYERSYDTVGVVTDYGDARLRALENGLTDEQYLVRLKELGVDGVSVYEDTLADMIRRDEVSYRQGADWRNDRRSLGQSTENIDPERYYLRSVQPGVAERFLARYQYPSDKETIDGQTWIELPIDVRGLIAGPDLALIERLKALGLFVVYRPLNVLQAVDPGADFPDVPYIVFGGTEVSGYGDEVKLAKVVERTARYITGLIEAVDVAGLQRGIEDVARVNPTVRVFAIPAEWQRVLEPEELASKYVLAAREREHRMLYMRPFPRLDETETFLRLLNAGLERAQLRHGPPVALEYHPNETLRWLAGIGPLAALVLLITAASLPRLATLVAVGVLALCVVGAGPDFDGLALLAACVFPALGFAFFRRNPFDWLVATLITTAGGLMVAAIGAGRGELLAIDPFRGVALTLVLPSLLVAVTMLPRQDIRKTALDLWNAPINLGTLAIAGLGLAAIALVLLRRGNTPSVGTSPTEQRVRAALQDTLIRPRTKEVLLHPAAILGLAGGWPTWFSNLLLLAGVVGQGSIIDSFAHYHTPLLITLLRTLNGIAFGGLLGFILLPAVGFASRLVTTRLRPSRAA